jgi:hypothetical protein
LSDHSFERIHSDSATSIDFLPVIVESPRSFVTLVLPAGDSSAEAGVGGLDVFDGAKSPDWPRSIGQNAGGTVSCGA